MKPHHTVPLLLLASALACEGTPAIHHTHTDVLWVTVCTLRADHLGSYGYEQPTSPRLDALARRGVLFERVLAPAAVDAALDCGDVDRCAPAGSGRDGSWGIAAARAA